MTELTNDIFGSRAPAPEIGERLPREEPIALGRVAVGFGAEAASGRQHTGDDGGDDYEKALACIKAFSSFVMPEASQNLDWRQRAACRQAEDPDLFFPISDKGPSVAQEAEAKSICEECGVKGQCLDWALETGQTGIWGGTNEDERRRIRRPAIALQLRHASPAAEIEKNERWRNRIPKPRYTAGAHWVAGFAGNFGQFRRGVNQNSERYDFEEQDRLVALVADGLKAEEALPGEQDGTKRPFLEENIAGGRGAREALADSFATRATYLAWQKWERGSAGYEHLEEVTQAALLGLMEGIVGYAKLPEEDRHAFLVYADKTMDLAIGNAMTEIYLSKSFDRKHRNAGGLGKFLKARRELFEKHAREPSIAEIADAIDEEYAHTFVLGSYATKMALYGSGSGGATTDDNAYEFLEDDPLYKPRSKSEQAEILTERALEFLGPQARQMIELRLGLNGEMALPVQEIARKLQLNESSVSAAYTRDVKRLKAVMAGLQEGDLDFEELRKSSVRNVLSIFSFAGVAAPESARLDDLKTIAYEYVESYSKSDRELRAMARLYNLVDGSAAMTQRDIATELGISPAMLRQVEGTVLQRMNR